MLRAPQEHEAFARSFVDEWQTILIANFADQFGLTPEQAKPYARLCTACIRGLMLDLLLTQQTDSIAEAAQAFEQLLLSIKRPA